MDQEEVLFGAPNRSLGLLSIALLRQPSGGCSIVVQAQPLLRRQFMTLRVNVPVEQSPSTALGLLAPLLHLHYTTPARWRQQAARVADRLGAEGYEVCLS